MARRAAPSSNASSPEPAPLRPAPSRAQAQSRGRYFTIPQAAEAYPGVLTERLIRRLVAERRIAYSYAGRRVVLAEADIEAYLDANRHEPLRGPCVPSGARRLSATPRTARSRPA